MSIKKHFNYGMIDQLDAAVLEMGYRDSDVSMLIILPNKRDGLAELEKKLESFDLQEILSQMGREEVEVFLPKFKIEYEFDLSETLKKVSHLYGHVEDTIQLNFHFSWECRECFQIWPNLERCWSSRKN
jgi:serine protease inhibitor